MATFNLLNKNKMHWVTLPEPDDSVLFFQKIKNESEKLWPNTVPNKEIYGFQFQQDSQWRPGLNDKQIQEFENAMGLTFPEPLKNFYKVMNGLTKQGLNVYGSSGTAPAFRSVFYSYPDDLQLIKEQINWIYDAISLKEEDIHDLDVSRIFPVYLHRLMLTDIPGNPILSMYGDDIIYYAENLSKLLANEIFTGVIHNVSDFECAPHAQPKIIFWLDDGFENWEGKR